MASPFDNNKEKGSNVTNATAAESSAEGPEEALSRCLLSQFRFCMAGVGLGTAYAVQTKGTKGYGLFPMVVGGVAGSAADLVYGYTVACLPERERYQLHRAQSAAVAAAAEAASSRSDSTPPPPTS